MIIPDPPERNRGEAFERVTALREKNPCATLQEIADAPGITLSRERVRQILVADGLPTKAYRPPGQQFVCAQCGNVFTPTPTGHNLKGPPQFDHTLYCGRKCAKASNEIPVTCIVCGTVRRYKRCNVLRFNSRFCNKHCQGRYFGRVAGFGAHPENAGGRHRKSLGR